MTKAWSGRLVLNFLFPIKKINFKQHSLPEDGYFLTAKMYYV